MTKNRRTKLLGLLLVFTISLAGSAQLAADKDKNKDKDMDTDSDQTQGDSPAKGLSCVRWTQQVVYRGLGYNHLVHLKNKCKSAAVCQVTTDVNPKAMEARLAPGEKTTVTTFVGSPARVFQAKVSCKAK